jgi:aldose 1-epimerase
MLRLASGRARAAVVPAMGGGLAALTVAGRPVLRGWDGRDDPFALALNLLAPFCNRISGGGFRFDGAFHALEPNLPGEPFPIHGDGFQRAWAVAGAEEDRCSLTLAGGGIGPFAWDGRVDHVLSEAALSVTLRLTNTGVALPFGLGFHPWFPRDAQTRITLVATGVWPEDARHLPLRQAPDPLPDGGPFASGAPLPDGFVNLAHAGWDGTARIAQGPDAVPVALTAPGLTVAQVYSPGPEAGFFCLEPVSHPVDAHNLPGRPGLVTLAPGESLGATMTLTWAAG